MKIYKRNNVYYIYYDRKKRVSTHCTTKEQLQNYLNNQNNDNWLQVQLIVNRYLRTNQYNDQTIYFYDITFQKICEIIPDSDPYNMTVMDIEAYKNERIKSVCAVTVNCEIARIKSMLNIMKNLELINKLPRITKLMEHRRNPKRIPPEELYMILGKCKPVIKDYIIFAVNTGLRLSEICNIDNENIIGDYVYVLNKATFKTKKDKERKVPMNQAAQAVLPTILKSKLLPKHLSKSFKKAVRELHLNELYTFHTLRKTFATNIARTGLNIFEHKAIMGHSDIRTSEIYYEPDLNEARKAVARI